MNETTEMRKPISKLPSFEIDDRFTVKIDYDLAVALGAFILDNPKIENPAIYAFGIRLKKYGDNK